jgi:hypothetical protein
MSAFTDNRVLLVEGAQPACETLSRALSNMNFACLRKDRAAFAEAKVVAKKAMADIQAGLDLLVEP